MKSLEETFQVATLSHQLPVLCLMGCPSFQQLQVSLNKATPSSRDEACASLPSGHKVQISFIAWQRGVAGQMRKAEVVTMDNKFTS